MRALPLLLLLVPSLAGADPAGDKGLANIDAALANTTLFAEYDIIHQDAGKPERKATAQVWRKAGKGFVEFLAPADLKGTKLLVLPGELYTFLPSFGKTRRINPSSTFGFTTFPDDLVGNGFAQRYTATQNGGVLTATLRSGAGGCAKLQIVVDQSWLPSTLTCTGANGVWTRLTRKKVKTGEAIADTVFTKRNLGE